MRHTDTHAVKNERRGRTGTRSKEQRVRNMPLSIARTSSVPPVISTKEESFFLNFFVVSGAKNTRKTYRLLEYERETYYAFFKEQSKKYNRHLLRVRTRDL